MKKTNRRKTTRRAVKDLTLQKGAKAVKGGATPVLMQACATGVHLKEATITH
jgi:hypothetical protein